MNSNKYLKKIKRDKNIILFIQISLILIFLITWEVLSDNKIINGFIFSSPMNIIKGAIYLYQTNNLLNHILTTLYEIIIAFSLGFLISFIITILLYINRFINRIIDPFLTLLNSMPKVVLGPLLIIWFGANTKSIIIMSLLINVIVSIITLYTGFISVNKYYLLLFKSLKANRLQTLIYLVIPSSINNIISSLKINISMTLIGVIMGEFLVSKSGIGYLIVYGTQVFNLNLVYIGIMLIFIISVI